MPQAEIWQGLGPHRGFPSYDSALPVSLEGAATCVWSYQPGIASFVVTKGVKASNPSGFQDVFS